MIIHYETMPLSIERKKSEIRKVRDNIETVIDRIIDKRLELENTPDKDIPRKCRKTNEKFWYLWDEVRYHQNEILDGIDRGKIPNMYEDIIQDSIKNGKDYQENKCKENLNKKLSGARSILDIVGVAIPTIVCAGLAYLSARYMNLDSTVLTAAMTATGGGIGYAMTMRSAKIIGEHMMKKELKSIHDDREGLKHAMMRLKRNFDNYGKMLGVDKPGIIVEDGKAHYLH